jgi:predicted secreted protein
LVINEDALAKHTTAAIASMFDLDNSLHRLKLDDSALTEIYRPNVSEDKNDANTDESSTNHKHDVSEISEIAHCSNDDGEDHVDDHNNESSRNVAISTESSTREDIYEVGKTATRFHKLHQEELAQCPGGKSTKAIRKQLSPIETVEESYTQDLVLCYQQTDMPEESCHVHSLKGQVESDSQNESYLSIPDRTIAEDRFDYEVDEMVITKNQHPETTVGVKNDSQLQAEGSFAASENGFDGSEVFADAKQTMDVLLDVNPDEETTTSRLKADTQLGPKQTMDKLLKVNPEAETARVEPQLAPANRQASIERMNPHVTRARRAGRVKKLVKDYPWLTPTEAKTDKQTIYKLVEVNPEEKATPVESQVLELASTEHQASTVKRMKANARARRVGRVKQLLKDGPRSTTKANQAEPRMIQMKGNNLLTRTIL